LGKDRRLALSPRQTVWLESGLPELRGIGSEARTVMMTLHRAGAIVGPNSRAERGDHYYARKRHRADRCAVTNWVETWTCYHLAFR